MKFTGQLESHHLALLLENGLKSETSKWKVPSFQGSTIKGTDISPVHYEQAVLWLEELRSLFHFYPETFFLAVTILNRMLASVKAHAKYLRCITVTSLYLAAKTNEEREVIPLVKDLVEQSECMCSSAEIVRMERIILDKLQWDLYMATPADFLNTFHAMVMSNSPSLFHGHLQINPSRHVALLTRQVQHCTACHQLLQFRGSTLALVIITLELELMTPDWFPITSDLLKKAKMTQCVINTLHHIFYTTTNMGHQKVESADFIHCKEMVDNYLETLAPSNSVYLIVSASKEVHSPNKAELACPTGGLCSKPLTVVSQKMNPPVANALASSTEPAVKDVMETGEVFDDGGHLYNEDCKANEGRINVSPQKRQVPEKAASHTPSSGALPGTQDPCQME